MIFNHDYNQIFKDQSSTFFSFPTLNNTLMLTNTTSSSELIPISHINEDFSTPLIEEMDDDSSIPDTGAASPIIEEVEEEVEEEYENRIVPYTAPKKKYSEIVFNINIGERCHTCSLDSYTLIQRDKELFNKFLNTSHVFQQSLFNFMKNLIINK